MPKFNKRRSKKGAVETACRVMRKMQQAPHDDARILTMVQNECKHSKAWINKTDAVGHTPLTMAASQGYLATVQFLVQKGANVAYTQRRSGDSCLSAAIFYGHFEVASYLIDEAGVDAQSLEKIAEDAYGQQQRQVWLQWRSCRQ